MTRIVNEKIRDNKTMIKVKETWFSINEIEVLLNRYIPKQVVDYGGVYLNCPKCHISNKEHEQKYCHECGQKLKW